MNVRSADEQAALQQPRPLAVKIVTVSQNQSVLRGMKLKMPRG
jgi:hypothetical protein